MWLLAVNACSADVVHMSLPCVCAALSVAPQVIEEHVLDMWPATEPGQEGAKLMLSYVVGECHSLTVRQS